MTERRLPSSDRCLTLAASLELDVASSGVCLACLACVSMPLAEGDDTVARWAARHIAPDIWHEGLADPLVAALVQAHADGVPGAGAALDDMDARGPLADVVQAVVLRLAAELADQAQAEFRLLTAARTSAQRGVPELN